MAERLTPSVAGSPGLGCGRPPLDSPGSPAGRAKSPGGADPPPLTPLRSASRLRRWLPAAAPPGGKARAKGEPGGPEGDTPATAPPRGGGARRLAQCHSTDRGEDVPLALGEFEGHGKWPLEAGRWEKRRSSRAHRKEWKNGRRVLTKKGQPAHRRARPLEAGRRRCRRSSRVHRKEWKNRRWVPTTKGRRTRAREAAGERTTGLDRKGTTSPPPEAGRRSEGPDQEGTTAGARSCASWSAGTRRCRGSGGSEAGSGPRRRSRDRRSLPTSAGCCSSGARCGCRAGR